MLQMEIKLRAPESPMQHALPDCLGLTTYAGGIIFRDLSASQLQDNQSATTDKSTCRAILRTYQRPDSADR
jgi:hypothetical protein